MDESGKRKIISLDDMYLDVAFSFAKKSTCLRAMHGAIIVNNGSQVSQGYCGAPRDVKSCYDWEFCLRQKLNIPSGEKYEMCQSVHAEENAIINAARNATSVLGGTLYLASARFNDAGGLGDNGYELIDAKPCDICKKHVINAGIETFVARQANGDIVKYSIDDWKKELQEKRLDQMSIQYDAGYTNLRNK